MPLTSDDSTPPAEQVNPQELTQHKDEQVHVLRSALVLGKNATTQRATKLKAKYNTLFTRMITRWEDYQAVHPRPRRQFR